MPKLINLSNTENKYFKILELSHIQPRSDRGNIYYYHCICKKCNSPSVVRSDYLRNGHTKSCGCELRKSGSQHKDWKGYGELSSARFSEIIHSAKIRGLSFKINLKFAWRLFEKQNRLCALTGLPMRMGNKNKDRGNASLDRINNTKGYTKNNVRWVLSDINLMKRTLTDEQMFFYCEKILFHKNNLTKTEI